MVSAASCERRARAPASSRAPSQRSPSNKPAAASTRGHQNGRQCCRWSRRGAVAVSVGGVSVGGMSVGGVSCVCQLAGCVSWRGVSWQRQLAHPAAAQSAPVATTAVPAAHPPPPHLPPTALLTRRAVGGPPPRTGCRRPGRSRPTTRALRGGPGRQHRPPAPTGWRCRPGSAGAGSCVPGRRLRGGGGGGACAARAACVWTCRSAEAARPLWRQDRRAVPWP
jgi:hypothetical protein